MKTKDGLWKFTPSSLYGFEECPACFWIENHIGRHPFGLPFRLNDAMDEKLKTRYDSFRQKGKLPPEIRHLKGISLFNDLETLNQWRNNRSSLRYINEKDGYILEGKLDEVFVNNKGELMPVDYKSSGDAPREDKHKYYVLQLHAYALMVQSQGLKVGDKAYLLHYFTKNRKDASLSMDFDFHIDEVVIDLDAFQKTLRKIVGLLENEYPGVNYNCEKCLWLEKRNLFLNKKY